VAKVEFNVLVHEEDDGSFWAEVKELPGCFASGFSMDELKEATAEAIQLWLPDGIKIEHVRWSDVKDPKGKASDRAKKPRLRRMLVCA
jgi:predicted RNase H-like HicB family nuclease